MAKASRIVVALILAGACGGSSSTGPAPVNFPSAAGVWSGTLRSQTGEPAGTVRLTIEQSQERPTGQVFMQRVFGRWNGSTPANSADGNFSGGIGTDGKFIVTLVTTSGPLCNISVDAQLSGTRIAGNYGRPQPSCTQWVAPDLGRLELTRE